MSSVSASITGRTSSSITVYVSWTPSSSAASYRARVTAGGRTAYISLGSSGTSGGSTTISGLSPNTSYSYSVLVQWNVGSGWQDGGASDSGSVTTYSTGPLVNSASYSGGYATVTWTQAQGGGASTISGRVFISDGSSTVASVDVTANNMNITRVNTGTLKGGTYYANVITWNSALNYDGRYASGSRVSFEIASYLLWSWSAANGSFNASAAATATLTQLNDAYTAITQHGKTTAFSWHIFNDLCHWVADLLSEAGGTWSDNYAALSGTYMTSSDKALTAIRWNSLSYNAQRAGSALGKTISFTARSKGDTVLGSYFTALVNNLNSAIEEV